MNIIAIDPSLSCTALVVNDKKFVYTSDSTATTKKGTLKGWFASSEDLVTVRMHKDIPTNLSYAELELVKINQFTAIANTIVSDIMFNCDPKQPFRVGIEGYSFSSAAGPLIDLVTIGTLIRTKLIANIALVNTSNQNSFEVMPPTTLKLKAAQLTYPAIPKNKSGTVLEWRNNDGVSGGKFKKHEIYKALTENKSFKCEWVEYLREHQDDILDMKNIPKPIEDVNDAKILYEILKAQ